MSKEWPQPSSPGMPPRVVVYFCRVIGASDQDVYTRGFMSAWQAGVWLRGFCRGELLWCKDVDDREESAVSYEVVLDKTADGAVLRSRVFHVRVVGAYWEDCMSASEGRSEDLIPWQEQQWLQAHKGEGVEKQLSLEEREEQAAAPAVARVGVAKAVGVGLVSVGVLCAENGVDPKDVRRELRKRGVEKDGGGWSFAEGSRKLGVVVEVIKFVKRKGR